MRGVRGSLIAATLFAALPAAAADPAIDSVTPTRNGDLVAATVHTSNLPGERVSASLKSGLPAAIEMRLETFDGKNRRVAENHLFYRIVWDLWDEVLRVEGPGEPRTLEGNAALATFLGDMPHLPAAAFAALDVHATHRLRVGCRLYPVAPRETERLTRWVAGGDEAGAPHNGDEREVSVGLSEVIRFFYKGSQRDPDELDPRFSAWFTPAELPDEGTSAVPVVPVTGEGR